MAWRPEADARLLLCEIASDTTPAAAIADQRLHTRGCRFDLLVVGPGPGDAMLQKELEELAAAHPGRLAAHTLWSRNPARRPLAAARVAECLAAIAPTRGTAATSAARADPSA